MLATIAIAALLAAADPAQENFEENQEEVVLYEDESEEIAINKDSECQDLFSEDESEISEDLLVEDDE